MCTATREEASERGQTARGGSSPISTASDARQAHTAAALPAPSAAPRFPLLELQRRLAGIRCTGGSFDAQGAAGRAAGTSEYDALELELEEVTAIHSEGTTPPDVESTIHPQPQPETASLLELARLEVAEKRAALDSLLSTGAGRRPGGWQQGQGA